MLLMSLFIYDSHAGRDHVANRPGILHFKYENALQAVPGGRSAQIRRISRASGGAPQAGEAKTQEVEKLRLDKTAFK